MYDPRETEREDCGTRRGGSFFPRPVFFFLLRQSAFTDDDISESHAVVVTLSARNVPSKYFPSFPFKRITVHFERTEGKSLNQFVKFVKKYCNTIYGIRIIYMAYI